MLSMKNLKTATKKEDIASQKELINSLNIKANKLKLDLEKVSIKISNKWNHPNKFKQTGEIANPAEPIYEIAKLIAFGLGHI